MQTFGKRIFLRQQEVWPYIYELSHRHTMDIPVGYDAIFYKVITNDMQVLSYGQGGEGAVDCNIVSVTFPFRWMVLLPINVGMNGMKIWWSNSTCTLRPSPTQATSSVLVLFVVWSRAMTVTVTRLGSPTMSFVRSIGCCDAFRTRVTIGVSTFG